MSAGRMIWTGTATGCLPRMGTCGRLRDRAATGHRTATGNGFGAVITAGRGWITRRGDGLRITTAGGFVTADTGGVGGRVLFWPLTRGIRRWWGFSAGEDREWDGRG